MILSFRSSALLLLAALFILRYFAKCSFGPFIDKKHGKTVDALIVFWLAFVPFFLPAFLKGLCMVPGDIFFKFYPWKAFYKGLSPHNPLIADPVISVYPWIENLCRSLVNGELPLWNAFAYSGSPFAANMISALYYPLNIFYFLMPIPDAFTFVPFLRLMIAASGLYFLLMQWRLSRGAAIAGGIMYAVCGVHVAWLSNYPELNVTVLLPWLILCLDRTAAAPRSSWLIAVSLLMGVQVLGGHIESTFHVFVFVAIFFLWRLYGERGRGLEMKEFARRAGFTLMAAVAGVMLSGVQLLPFLEYLPLTSRYAYIDELGRNMFNDIPFVEIIKHIGGTLLTPDIYGNPVHGNYFGQFNYNEQNSYITVTGLFLAGIAWRAMGSNRNGHGRIILFFILTALCSFLIAVQFPLVYDLIAALPFFKEASNHRLVFLFSFAAAVLASFGADLIARNGIPLRHLIPWAVLLVLSGLSYHLGFSHGLDQAQLLYRRDHLLISLGFLVLLMAVISFKKLRSAFPWVAALLILGDSFICGGDYNTFMKKEDIFPRTPLIEFLVTQQQLQEQGGAEPFRVACLQGTLPRGSELLFGWHSIIGMDPMKLNSYEQVLADINGVYEPVETLELNNPSSRWLNYLNVKYLVTPPGPAPLQVEQQERFHLVYRGKDGKVYENRSVLPRYYFVPEAVFTENRETSFAGAKENRGQLGQIAFIEHKAPFHGGESGGSVGSSVYSCAPVIITPHTVNMSSLETVLENSSGHSGWLVSSHVAYPGWKAELDGVSHPVFRVNGTFLAVFVPENTTEIRFYHEPASFKYGLIISMAGFIMLLFMAVRCRNTV